MCRRVRKCCDRERSRDSAQNKAARSGNRPRFKWIRQSDYSYSNNNNTTEMYLRPQLTGVRNGPRRRVEAPRSWLSPNRALFFATIIIPAIITFTSVDCDQHFLQYHTDNHLGSLERPKDSLRPKERPERSHLVLLDEASEEDKMRVASMVSKLEQWFVCQRRLAASGLEPWHDQSPESLGHQDKSDQSSSIASGAPQAGSVQAQRCPASYDGHLCWPPSLANEQPVRMACPRVRALPSEQEQQSSQQADSIGPKSAQSSVISSPTMPVMQLAAQQANSSGEKVIALVAAPPGERTGSIKLTNDAAQDTVNDTNGKGEFSKGWASCVER